MSLPSPQSLLQRWQQAGLLTPEQVQAILDFEGAQTNEPAKVAPTPAAMISLIGALVLGLGMIALVAANWGTLPREVKFAGLVALTLLSYGLGYLLRDRAGATWPATGAALYLLGGVLYGAVLGFLAQGMQLGLSINTLLTLWGAGLFALAYAVRLPPALHLALPLGAIIPLLGLYGDSLGWLWASGSETANLVVMLLCGLAFLVVTWWHDHRWPSADRTLGRMLGNPWAFWSVPLLLSGLLGLLAELFLGTERWFADGLILPLLLILAAFALLNWGKREGRRAIQNWSVLALGLSLLYLAVNEMNLLGGALGLGLALWGGKNGEGRLVNLGLVAVGVAVLTFYFRVFSALLDISLVLVGAGLLLLGLGYLLERTRRRLNSGGQG